MGLLGASGNGGGRRRFRVRSDIGCLYRQMEASRVVRGARFVPRASWPVSGPPAWVGGEGRKPQDLREPREQAVTRRAWQGIPGSIDRPDTHAGEVGPRYIERAASGRSGFGEPGAAGVRVRTIAEVSVDQKRVDGRVEGMGEGQLEGQEGNGRGSGGADGPLGQGRRRGGVRRRWGSKWGVGLAWRAVTWRRVLATGLVVAGLGATAAVALTVRSRETAALHDALRRKTGEAVQILQTELARSVDTLRSVEAAFVLKGEMSREEFRGLCGRMLSSHDELRGLGWSPLVLERDREAFEKAARAEGTGEGSTLKETLGGFKIRPATGGRVIGAGGSSEVAGGGGERGYLPVHYIEPTAENARVLGYDIASNAGRWSALENAARTRSVMATSPVLLEQTGGTQSGIILYYPVFGPAVAGPGVTGAGVTGAGVGAEAGTASGHRLRGFVSAVYTVDHLMASVRRRLEVAGLKLELFDCTEGKSLIYSWAGEAGDTAQPLKESATLKFAGREWRLEFGATGRFESEHVTRAPWTIAAAGSTITLLSAMWLVTLLRRTQEVERKVVRRTGQLSREVSERRRAEQAARQAEDRYRSIFENAVEGIFQSTPTGQYLSANRSLARIYGYASPGELVQAMGSIADELYVDPGRRDDFIRLIQARGYVEEFESRVRRRDGRIIWISENARVVKDERGRAMFFEGMVVDITARKEAEESLRRNRDVLELRVAERTRELNEANTALRREVTERKAAEERALQANRAKTDFVNSLSHELRTPMNSVLGYAQLLLRDPSLTPRQQEAVGAIVATGRHLSELLTDILDLAKIESGAEMVSLRRFTVQGLLAEVESMFRQRCLDKGLELKVEARGCGGRVRGDERKLRQVLINLCCNAIKFTERGSVVLRATGCCEDNEEGKEGRKAGGVRFEVIDTGVGISQENCRAIFEPFRQVHRDTGKGGSGLGLAIAKRQVEMLGGELTVESRVGRGSRFSFEIELLGCEGEERAAARAAGHSGGSLGGRSAANPGVRALGQSGGRAGGRAKPDADVAAEAELAAMSRRRATVAVPAGLSDDTRRAILAAADLHSLTELRKHVSTLERELPEAADLTRALRDCLRRCDMHGIAGLLTPAEHPSPEARSEAVRPQHATAGVA